jgi:hypothetical protein
LLFRFFFFLKGIGVHVLLHVIKQIGGGGSVFTANRVPDRGGSIVINEACQKTAFNVVNSCLLANAELFPNIVYRLVNGER